MEHVLSTLFSHTVSEFVEEEQMTHNMTHNVTHNFQLGPGRPGSWIEAGIEVGIELSPRPGWIEAELDPDDEPADGGDTRGAFDAVDAATLQYNISTSIV